MLHKMKSEIALLGRHIEVLRAVSDHGPIGIIKLSEMLSLPHHRIRYSLRILEQLGYIQASPSGAVTTERAHNLLLSLNEDLDDLVHLIESIRNRNNT